MKLNRSIFLHFGKRGLTLIEICITFALVGMVFRAIHRFLPSFFKLNSITRRHINQISDIQVLLNYFNRYLVNVDNLYLDRVEVDVTDELGDTRSEEEINRNKILFRRTYLPRELAFTTHQSSLKTRWGCFWFKPGESVPGVQSVPGVLKYFETEEMSFHKNSSLEWHQIKNFKVRTVSFSYQMKQLTVSIDYLRGEVLDTRVLIFHYDRSQIDEEAAERLDESEYPSWS